MVALFAAIAICVIWTLQFGIRKARARHRGGLVVPLLLLFACFLGLAGCPTETDRRVSGIDFLIAAQGEAKGYGLYSYALLPHKPSEAELPRYRAFVEALLGLPKAKDLGNYVEKSKINVTYIPLAKPPKAAGKGDRVGFVLDNYDYARCAAILATLPQQAGPGPVIVSALTPMSSDPHPHPVLVQDLSTAQPVLVADCVAKYVNQIAQQRFWEPNALSEFSLSLRNLLETTAVGLGMSKDAVKSWITFSK